MNIKENLLDRLYHFTVIKEMLKLHKENDRVWDALDITGLGVGLIFGLMMTLGVVYVFPPRAMWQVFFVMANFIIGIPLLSLMSMKLFNGLGRELLLKSSKWRKWEKNSSELKKEFYLRLEIDEGFKYELFNWWQEASQHCMPHFYCANRKEFEEKLKNYSLSQIMGMLSCFEKHLIASQKTCLTKEENQETQDKEMSVGELKKYL